MKTKVDQNEIITRRILSEEFNKFELRFEKKMDEKFDKHFSHHFGLAMEFMEDKFKLVMEGIAGVPSDMIILKEKAIVNEREHVEFKTKLEVLTSK
jgi:hypothetical protein